MWLGRCFSLLLPWMIYTVSFGHFLGVSRGIESSETRFLVDYVGENRKKASSNFSDNSSVSLDEVSFPMGKKGHGRWVYNFIPLLIVVMCYCIFIYKCVSIWKCKKKIPKTAKEKENWESAEESPMTILTVKVEEEEEETKSEDEPPDLVFFVEEHMRFKIEDLLASKADLQGHSEESSLYIVTLRNNAVFAVKRLKNFQVSVEEFGHAMTRIGNLAHPNLLPLVAYHSSNKEKLLIYRYQRNGSLLSLLEDYSEGKRAFPWRLRLLIASGIVRGLDYLYRESWEESGPHGNLKPSNILLSNNEEPLISEYGSRRFLDLKRHDSCNGYRAPEETLTEKSDVFSLGVILLVLLTGKTVEKSGLDLPKWVEFMLTEEWTGEVFDKEVNKAARQWAFPMLNVSLKCVSQSPENRPNVAEVLEKIQEVVNEQED